VTNYVTPKLVRDSGPGWRMAIVRLEVTPETTFLVDNQQIRDP
jgi:hypothetical protein